MFKAPSTALNRTWQRLADREAARIRDTFMQDAAPPVQQQVWGNRSRAAHLLAGAVLLVYVGVVTWGLWGTLVGLGLIPAVSGVTRLLIGFFALLALLFGWLARPRMPGTGGVVLSMQQAPELHALVRQVATELGVTAPVQIVLTPDVNASMGQSGWRHTPTLELGLGLWFGARPQERVAVIAHELAHLRNSDPARSWGIWWASRVLLHAASALFPFAPYLFMYFLLQNLIGAQQQSAEYRADRMAAGVAGSAACTSLLDRMHLGCLFDVALNKQRYLPERPHVFLELRHQWDSVTPEGWARLRQEVAEQCARLDNTHPPTVDRIRVVEAWPHQATVVLNEEAALRLDAELEPFVRRLEQVAIDEYRIRMAG